MTRPHHLGVSISERCVKRYVHETSDQPTLNPGKTVQGHMEENINTVKQKTESYLIERPSRG